MNLKLFILSVLGIAALHLTASAETQTDANGTLIISTNVGTVSDLILNDGAVLVVDHNLNNGGLPLTVTGSLDFSSLTVDFSNIFVQNGQDYVLIDYSAATGSEGNWTLTAIGLGEGQQGGFFTQDGLLLFNTAAVPEPSTWLLLGAGLGALTLIRRRQ
ncbi:MAG: PEP-CTERM sorting domain-containing protein [Verrucomicrobiales bacterium]|nr:PEP-CTERM sorting domain-containing protein [Verrucomicrobiales bacterium]